MYYSLTSPQVAELLAVARRILTEVLSGQVELLADLRASPASAPAATPVEVGPASMRSPRLPTSGRGDRPHPVVRAAV